MLLMLPRQIGYCCLGTGIVKMGCDQADGWSSRLLPVKGVLLDLFCVLEVLCRGVFENIGAGKGTGPQTAVGEDRCNDDS